MWSLQSGTPGRTTEFSRVLLIANSFWWTTETTRMSAQPRAPLYNEEKKRKERKINMKRNEENGQERRPTRRNIGAIRADIRVRRGWLVESVLDK